MSGFVVMHREALDHPLLRDGERFRAWFWLVANAAWKPTKARIKGTIVELARGELTFSVRFLAENWGWSKSRVDRFIADLRDEGMIETRTKSGTTSGTNAGHNAGQGQSIITICNYAKYQDVKEPSRDNDNQKSGQVAGQQRDKEEQGNNIPSSEDEGASPDSIFWKNAKAYLAPHVKGDPGRLIGKWCKGRTQDEVAAALTSSQLSRAVDPVPYIEATLRKGGSGGKVDAFWG